MTATAANALSGYAVGLFAGRDDLAAVVDRDLGAVIAGATGAADADTDIAVLRTVKIGAEPAIAAAAANALCVDTGRPAKDCADVALACHRNGTALRACAALAADADADIAAVLAGNDTGANAESGIAAAATDALCQDAG